jgi:hypothetical protein
MKTKALLLLAALISAAAFSSIAQEHSLNVVGYAKITIPAGKQAILNNPLNGANNNVNTIMPLGNNAGNAGSAIFRYDPANARFLDPIEWFDDFGWFSASDNDPTLLPGEGFYFRNANTNAVRLNFKGEVFQGMLGNPIPGRGKLSFRGSQRPLALPLGDTTINSAGTLKFPADDGDAIFFYNNTKIPPGFDDPFEYFQDYGWYSASNDQGPAGPVINVGQGFAVRKLASDKIWGGQIWEVNPFSVE